MSWLTVIKYAAPLVVIGLLMLVVNNRAYDRGKQYCIDEMIPKAQEAEQKICQENARITEKTNAKQLQAANDARAVANAQRDSLRRQYKAIPCVPVTYIASVDSGGTETIHPAEGNGIDAWALVDLAERCEVRSQEYLNARQFMLDVWEKHQKK